MIYRLKYSFFVLLFTLCTVNAQDKKIQKANESFNRYEFTKAIAEYEELVENGTNSAEIYRNLGDANYLNATYGEAAKWYELLGSTGDDALDVEHVYRYANSLRSVQRYKASDKILQQLNKLEIQASGSAGSMGDYMSQIKKRFGSYTIKNIEINSTESDFAPSFRLDGLIFSTARDTSGVSKNIHNWNKKRFLDLYRATRDDEGGFSNITRFSSELNSKLHESSTAFTKDGRTVYFTRNKAKRNGFGRDKKGISRLKLYKASFKSGKWKNIQELPFNRDGYSVAHPTLNEMEDKLYFASDIEGTKGQSDIFVIDINSDGSYGAPKNLGVNINTGGRETFPYVTDADILYFASDGHPGLGGLDVFAVDLKNVETSKIVNLGEPLNSVEDDFSFIIGSENKRGYFASNRDGGMGSDDIYAFTELKPIDTKCLSSLSGIVKEKRTSSIISNSHVLLIDENGLTLAETESDSKGAFMLQRKCTISNFSIVASKETYEPERKSFEQGKGKADVQNITLLLDRIDTGAMVGTDLAKYLKIAPIYFDSDKSFIREDAKLVLATIINYMNTYPNAKIEVRSHTDSRASSTYNEALSEKRAKETVAYVMAQGIASSRIIGNGFGESQLINPCNDITKCSEENHQRNRRSEFIVIE